MIRPFRVDDLPAVTEMTENKAIDHTVWYIVYPTLVAEVKGFVVGFTQFTMTLDGVLYSTSLRVDSDWQGRGIAKKLMQAKIELARRAGATRHFYPVDAKKESLKKICEDLGMHLCRVQGDVHVYAHDISETPNASA